MLNSENIQAYVDIGQIGRGSGDTARPVEAVKSGQQTCVYDDDASTTISYIHRQLNESVCLFQIDEQASRIRDICIGDQILIRFNPLR